MNDPQRNSDPISAPRELALPLLHSAERLSAESTPLAEQALGPRDIRFVDTLRISVTDRCNFRCLYCMPDEELDWLSRDELLRYEEIVAIARTAISLGVRDFKITGGEPLLRRDLESLVRELRALEGTREISLTSNGMILDRFADPLAKAGVDRVTVSLDTLDPAKFRAITRRGDLEQVWEGIRAAESVGLGPVKINVVAMRTQNLEELAEFAALTRESERTVRFIEFMPLADSQLDERQEFVPYTEIRTLIERVHGPLEPAQRDTGNGPANVFRIPGAPGRIGFIHAMSQPFCATCNRLRLTAEGQLRSCLFDGGEVELKPLVRPHVDSAALRQAFVDCVRLKPDQHRHYGTRQMSQIGG